VRFQWSSGVLFRKHKKIGRCGRQDILSWATTLGPVFALSLSRSFHRLGNVVGKVQFAFEHYLLVCLFRKALQEHACRAALASRSWSFVLIARACVGIKKVSALFTRTCRIQRSISSFISKRWRTNLWVGQSLCWHPIACSKGIFGSTARCNSASDSWECDSAHEGFLPHVCFHDLKRWTGVKETTVPVVVWSLKDTKWRWCKSMFRRRAL